MIEIVAVGMAAVVTGIAAKGLNPLARALGESMFGKAASNKTEHPLMPNAFWEEHTAPGCYSSHIFQGFFKWPDEPVHFTKAIDFKYYISPGGGRPNLVRTGGGGLVTLQSAREDILRSAQKLAFRLYQQSAHHAIAQHNASVELNRMEKIWLDALQADKTRVVKELQAGRQAQFSREWHAEALLGGNAATQAARRSALEEILGDVEASKRRLRQAAENAERDRTEAVRHAAESVAAERRLMEARDRQAAAVAAEAARRLKLSRPIPLALSSVGVVFGTQIMDGADFAVPVSRLQHMLITGVSGAGKSVMMHSLLYQFLRLDEVERLVLIDLKGGVSFYRYNSSPKVEVVYEMPEVMRVIDGLMALMVQRQDVLRKSGKEFWRGGRVFVVIDEYAEIQTEIDSADTKEAKAAARRLAANLASISRRARALGIVLVCALQRPTLDAMDSAVRNNLSCRVCMRAATNQLAASILDDLERLPLRPTELPTGQFYYYDASRGVTQLLKAQIAPGVDLADS